MARDELFRAEGRRSTPAGRHIGQDTEDDDWEILDNLDTSIQEQLTHRRGLEVADSERQKRNRILQDERTARQQLADELEWMELSAKQIRLRLKYDGMWHDMMAVLFAVEARERLMLSVEEHDDMQKLLHLERITLAKLTFRRNFDLMLQEMEATLLVLEQRRRTRLVVTEDKEWAALQHAIMNPSKTRSLIAPSKVTQVTVTRLSRSKPPEKPPPLKRSTTSVAVRSLTPEPAGLRPERKMVRSSTGSNLSQRVPVMAPRSSSPPQRFATSSSGGGPKLTRGPLLSPSPGPGTAPPAPRLPSQVLNHPPPPAAARRSPSPPNPLSPQLAEVIARVTAERARTEATQLPENPQRMAAPRPGAETPPSPIPAPVSPLSPMTPVKSALARAKSSGELKRVKFIVD